MVKTIEQIQKAYENGEYTNQNPRPKRNNYKEGYVFDEDQSVKWNREKRERTIEKEGLQREQWDKEHSRLLNILNDEVVEAIIEYVGIGAHRDSPISKNQAQLIYDRAYSKKHGEGMYDVLNYVYELCDFVDDFLNAK